MSKSRILRIKRSPNWIGDFSIDYDGKYIGLRGKDSNYPGFSYSTEPTEEWFEEMILGGAFAEGRNLLPSVIEATKEYVYINIGDDRESLAWTKLVEDPEKGLVFDPDYFTTKFTKQSK